MYCFHEQTQHLIERWLRQKLIYRKQGSYPDIEMCIVIKRITTNKKIQSNDLKKDMYYINLMAEKLLFIFLYKNKLHI